MGRMPTLSTLNGGLGFSSLTMYGPRDVQRRRQRWRRRWRLSFERNRAMYVFQATADCDVGDRRFCTPNVVVRNDVGVNRKKKRKKNYPNTNVHKNQITDSSPSGSGTHINAREFDDKQNASNERFDNTTKHPLLPDFTVAPMRCAPGPFPINRFLFICLLLLFSFFY